MAAEVGKNHPRDVSGASGLGGDSRGNRPFMSVVCGGGWGGWLVLGGSPLGPLPVGPWLRDCYTLLKQVDERQGYHGSEVDHFELTPC